MDKLLRNSINKIVKFLNIRYCVKVNFEKFLTDVVRLDHRLIILLKPSNLY